MFGWHRRTFFPDTPSCLPSGVRAAYADESARMRVFSFLFCLAFTFLAASGIRLLEIPFWDNPSYALNGERLLATHDAYHWIAGADGFEFGTGHPMSELVRIMAGLFGVSPAAAGFWMPPFLSGLLAVAVFLWGWSLGQPFAGTAAGILASLAPAFFARTLLGFYDTDLIVLLFAVLIGLVPALWLSPWLASPPDVFLPRFMRRLFELRTWKTAPPPPLEAHEHGPGPSCPGMPHALAALHAQFPGQALFYGKNARESGVFALSPADMRQAALNGPWLALLILSGLFGWQTQAWHSFFPYLARYCAILPLLLILLLGPAGGRRTLLKGAICHSLPLLLGLPGAIAATAYAALQISARDTKKPWIALPAESRALLCLLWGIIIYCVLDTTIFDIMLRSFSSYADRSGHIGSNVADPVVFPSVARSIIEVQTISFFELLIYNHPVEVITFIALLAAFWRMLISPAFLWLLPLLVLSILSLRMGARMTMFGPPVLMLALCMEGGALLGRTFHALSRMILLGKTQPLHIAPCPYDRVETIARLLARVSPPLRFAAALFLCALLAYPLITPLPDYVQGPIISREQAAGLAFLKEHSPEDSLVWNWWDWGYATHHFSRRHTIADGARHGGPSLYLPAAVYTTADPRFARQVIKYTAGKGNTPGNVFAGLSAAEAQELMRALGDKSKPLIEAPGKQYMVVSLDLLRLGLWVTRYGSWNFITREGPGALMNNLTPALRLNTDTGEIISGDAKPVYAAGITFFSPNGLEHFSYDRPGAYHFLFNVQPPEQDQDDRCDWISRFWTMQRGYNPFSSGISDKLAMDAVFFNTMMVQLLVRPKDDPFIAPYFKLVFDNTYTRIYEVR